MKPSEVLERALVEMEDADLYMTSCLCDFVYDGEAADYLDEVTDQSCFINVPIRSKRFTFRNALLAAASLARSEEESQ